MQEIYIENLKKIILNKKKLEKEFKIKLTNKGKNIFIEGFPDNEFIAIGVLKALDLGFSLNQALQLKQEEIILQTINIKDITKRQDLKRVRARIIGTHRRALNTLENLTKCDICLHENKVGIIGNTTEIEDAVQAIMSIIQGSKHGNVYARAERQRKNKRISKKIG